MWVCVSVSVGAFVHTHVCACASVDILVPSTSDLISNVPDISVISKTSHRGVYGMIQYFKVKCSVCYPNILVKVRLSLKPVLHYACSLCSLGN